MATVRRKQPERKARGDYHHGNLRRALLEAAVVILAQHGTGAFTLREAARRVGVDHRAAYRHYAEREGLLAVVAQEAYEVLVSEVKEELAAAGPSARERLLAIAVAYTRFAIREPGRYWVIAGPYAYQRYPETDAVVDEAFALIVTEVARGIERGEVLAGDQIELAAWLWSAMHGLTHLILIRRVRVRRDLLADFTRKMIGRSLDGVLRS